MNSVPEVFDALLGTVLYKRIRPMVNMIKIVRPAEKFFPTAPTGEADDVEVTLVLVAFEHLTSDAI